MVDFVLGPGELIRCRGFGSNKKMGTMKSAKCSVQVWVWVCLGLLVLVVSRIHVVTGAPKIHIPDELDDVEDNEEDEEWKAWGTPKSRPIMDGPPPDPPEDPEALVQYQLDMMKRQTGPSMGFVKLRLGVQRKPVSESTHLVCVLAATGVVNALRFVFFPCVDKLWWKGEFRSEGNLVQSLLCVSALIR